MKFFIATISLLIGIIIGSAITAFLVVKKNPMIRENLCKNFTQSTTSDNTNPLSGLMNSSFLKENLNNIIKTDNPITENNIDEKTKETTTETNKIPLTIPEKTNDQPQKEFPVAGPGGCKTEDGCLAYCSKLENLKECLDFAKKYMEEPTQD